MPGRSFASRRPPPAGPSGRVCVGLDCGKYTSRHTSSRGGKKVYIEAAKVGVKEVESAQKPTFAPGGGRERPKGR